MDTTKILIDLYAEQSRIVHAIAALESLLGGGTQGGTSIKYGTKEVAGRRTMSAEARALIGAAQKKRWAKQKRAAARAAQAVEPAAAKKAVPAKKATKKSTAKKVFAKKAPAKKTAVKKAAPVRHMSAAARKRIGEATKARWAAKKAAAAPVAATSAATA